MVEFNTAYSAQRGNYFSNPGGYLGEFQPPPQDAPAPRIEGQISVGEMGASVTEGRQFGSFIQTAQNMIRQGVGRLELATNMGGGPEAVGAEAYGQDARQALREISRANQVDIISIHSPTNIGNMSGFNPQERGFNDEHRKIELEEVKKAIDFAADTGGGAVVVHTGEFQRDISDQKWAKDEKGNYMFLGYDEEPGRNTLYMVDDRTGKLVSEVRKSMVVREPEFKQEFDPQQNRYRYVDKDGNFLNESEMDDLFKRVPDWDQKHTRFKTRRVTWDDFVKRADEWNRFHKRDDNRLWTPEEMFMRAQLETRILQARGSSLFHGQQYDDLIKNREEIQRLLNLYKGVEEKMNPDEQWQLMEEKARLSQRYSRFMHQGRKENKLPSELLKDELDEIEKTMKFIHESSASADANADETFETLQHVVPVGVYAKENTSKSYAEVGIHAMEQSQQNPHAKRDIFVAPENIFPEMGYGSHPEELIKLVQDAREKMVEYLTEPYIPDPRARERDENGNLKKVPNPYYRKMSKEQAQKEAEQHIRATLDTQHLGMWWKHFQPKPGETVDQRKERFDDWYMDQIKRMEKENILGHIHVVDAIGGGHQHLPLGQGNLPVKKALEYLKKKGYGKDGKGTMISEAWGENALFGAGRQMTETWRALGMPISSVYSSAMPGGGQSWGNIQHSYLGRNAPPYFIFGSYSPSNDWQLWSQTPME